MAAHHHHHHHHQQMHHHHAHDGHHHRGHHHQLHEQAAAQQQQQGWVSAADLEQHLVHQAASQKQLAQEQQEHVLKAVVSVADLEAQLLAAAGGGAAASGTAVAAADASADASEAAELEGAPPKTGVQPAVDGEAAPPPPPSVPAPEQQQEGQPSYGAAGMELEQQQQQVSQQANGTSSAGGAHVLRGVEPPQRSHIRFESDSEEEPRAEEEQGQGQQQQQQQGQEQPGVGACSGPAAGAAEAQVEQLAADMRHMMAVSPAAAGGLEAAEVEAGAGEGDEEHLDRQRGAAGDAEEQLDQQHKKKSRKKKKKGQQDKAPQQAGEGSGGGGRRPVHLPAAMDRKLEKYWLQRYSLFSRWGHGWLAGTGRRQPAAMLPRLPAHVRACSAPCARPAATGVLQRASTPAPASPALLPPGLTRAFKWTTRAGTLSRQRSSPRTTHGAQASCAHCSRLARQAECRSVV